MENSFMQAGKSIKGWVHYWHAFDPEKYIDRGMFPASLEFCAIDFHC